MKNALLVSGKCSKCECDLHKFSISHNPSYCRYCYAQYKRDRYKDPEYKKRHTARLSAMRLVNSGIIIIEPCKLCGESNSEMHHPDYEKPNDVTFLCNKCHNELHALERKVLCA